jgi:hypothetical protein
VRLETAEFILDLPGDWEQFPGDADAQFQFESKALKASIVVSYILVQFPRERLLETAQVSLTARLEALEKLGPHQVHENFAELQDDGPMGHSVLLGQSSDSVFWSEAWTTEAKSLHLWIAVETDDIDEARKIVAEVFAGFSFYLP